MRALGGRIGDIISKRPMAIHRAIYDNRPCCPIGIVFHHPDGHLRRQHGARQIYTNQIIPAFELDRFNICISYLGPRIGEGNVQMSKFRFNKARYVFIAICIRDIMFEKLRTRLFRDRITSLFLTTGKNNLRAFADQPL